MDTKQIEERFGSVAQSYDEQRKKFIPCFDDYYTSMIDFIFQSFAPPKSIVDLGAGTGLLTKFFYDKYPNAKYTLIDVSEEMLQVAKQRFPGNKSFQFIISDYSNDFSVQDSDLILSGLSIHHLANVDKQKLYRNVYKSLSSHGLFINFDQFNSDSAAINSYYNKYWYDQIKKSGLPKSEHERWLKRRELDKENSIDDTKKMLKDAGFSTVECIYSYMKFGVVVAQK